MNEFAQLTRDNILQAMKEFDLKFRSSEYPSGTRYAIEDSGKIYPPKRLLELATGVPRSRFSGGKSSNNVFAALEFRVVETVVNRSRKAPEEDAEEQKRLNEPVPDAEWLLEELFTRTWAPLDRDSVRKLADSKYPGVYVLAYANETLPEHPSKKDLTGDRVKEDDIYYVGVSQIQGVRTRLQQFLAGLERGDYHSGAIRFFTDVAMQAPYSIFEQRGRFFVASISVPCIPEKGNRSELDLRKLGVLAQLEWDVLARVKAKIGKEPWLNKR